jgi:IS5 family transposase
VPAADKLVSLFEPHSVVIRRGKAHVPAEFGRKLALDEVDGGLVSRYAILQPHTTEGSVIDELISTVGDTLIGRV